MNKKLLISVLLGIFAFSLGMFAEEKPKTIELLVWEEMGRWDDYILFWSPDAPYSFTSFETGPFMRKSVPPSPKSDVLFFEVQLLGSVRKQSDATDFGFLCDNSWEIYSDVIPPNVQVCNHVVLGQCLLQHQIVTGGKLTRYAKVSMKRNSEGWWQVRYKDTNNRLLEEDAISILNSLIDNGFDIEFSYKGWVRGVEQVRIFPFSLEITRLSKQ